MRYEKLTTPQQNIWNLQKYYPDTAIANLCGAIFYNEKRDVEKLKEALNLVIEKQAGFRLRFQEEGEVRQYVAEYEEIDIPAMTFEAETEFDEFANCFAKEPFGLTNCVLYRFVVFEIDGKSGVLVLLSHLISDAWTFSILAREIDHAYGKLQGKEDTDLLQADYMDYVEAEQKYFASAKYEKDAQFWQDKYANPPEDVAIKMAASTSDSIEAKRMVKTLPAELEKK